jgi:hypothetical protein
VLGLVSLAGIDDRANFAHVALMGFANKSIFGHLLQATWGDYTSSSC